MSDMNVSLKVIPFESVSELREAHTNLLAELDKQLGQDASAENEVAALAKIATQIRQFVERGVATGVYIEEIKERTDCQILLDYWVSGLSHAGMQMSATRLTRFDGQQLPDLKDKPCPYAGLEAFRDRTFFFGRETATRELLDKIRNTLLVVVLGESGSGKSSLVMGGALPALREKGATPELRIIPPFVPGNAVLNHLADAVAGICTGVFRSVADEAETLRQDPMHLRTMVGGADAPATLITIDQFEEIFTLSDPSDREVLMANLVHFLEAGRGHHVILTMREEFKSHMAELRTLSPYMDKAWFSIRPMSYEELEAAVKSPAAMVNLQFQSGIVDDLVKKVLGQPAALPLLQFTLRSLWDKRDRNRITWEVYRKVGDPLNALKASADRFFDGLVQQSQDEAKRILLELVRVDEMLEAYRQPVPKDKLLQTGKANTEEVLELLAENDYVRIISGLTDTDVLVEVKHESLVRNWPRFVAWIDEKRLQRRQRLAITQAAQRWSESGCPPEGLLTGWQAEAAKDLADLSKLEEKFIQTSMESVNRKQQEEIAARVRETQRRYVFGASVFLMIVFFGFCIYFKRQNTEVEYLKKSAEVARDNAEKARDKSEGLVSFLIGEKFLAVLRPVGRTSIMKTVQDEVTLRLDSMDDSSGHDNPLHNMNKGLAFRNNGDLYSDRGHLRKATENYSKAALEFRELLKRSPSSPELKAELGRTLRRWGTALDDQRLLTKALDKYTEALSLLNDIVEPNLKDNRSILKWVMCSDNKDTSNNVCKEERKDALYELALCHAGIGSILVNQGELQMALKYLERAIALVKPLYDGGDHAPKILAALSVARYRKASVLKSMGKDGEARDCYERTRYVVNKWKEENPLAADALQAYAVSVAQMSNTLFEENNPGETLKNYLEIHNCFDQFKRWDPNNRKWLREWAETRAWIAYANVALNTEEGLKSAKKIFPQALEKMKGLCKLDQSNASWKSDLAGMHGGYSDVLAKANEVDGAMAEYRKAIELSKEVANLDPSNASERFSLGWYYFGLGSMGSEKVQNYRKARDIASELERDHRANVEYVRLLYYAYLKESEALQEAGNKIAGDKAMRNADRVLNRALARLPRNAALEQLVAKHWVEKGNKAYNAGKYPEALSAYKKAVESSKKAIENSPKNPVYLDSLRNEFENIAYVHIKQKQWRLEVAAREQALRAAQKIIELRPQNQEYRNSLYNAYQSLCDAYLKGNTPQDADDKYRQGVELLKRVAKTDQDFLNLGSFHERMGDAYAPARYDLIFSRGQRLDSAKAKLFYEEMIKAYWKASGLNPQNNQISKRLIRAKIKMADILTTTGSPEEKNYLNSLISNSKALVHIEGALALEKDPNKGDYHERLARIYEQIGGTLENERAFSTALEAYKKMEASVKDATELDDKNDRYWNYRGLAHYRSGNVLVAMKKNIEAISEFRHSADCVGTAIKLKSEVPVYHYNISYVRKQIGDICDQLDAKKAVSAYRDALKAAEKAVQLEPQNETYRDNRNELRTKLQSYK